jgi:hypothetical protein
VSDTEEVTQLIPRERPGRDRGWWAEFYRRTWEWLRSHQEK